MAYKIHPDLKPLSANLKRLNVGKSFRLKDFEYELEENKLDVFWNFCKDESGYKINVLTSNLDEIFSEIFIIGLSIIYQRFTNPIGDEKSIMRNDFNKFFSVCFVFYLNNHLGNHNYSKIIDIINNLEVFEKNIISLISIENETSEYVDAEIIFNKDPFIKNSHSTKKYQIFISSTFTDLINERQASVEAILKKGHIPAGMELFSANNKSQWEVIKKWIDDSDIYVLLLGGRYGSIDNETGLSYTEMEFNYAIEKGKPFFALILGKEILDNKDVDIIKDYDLKDPKYIAFKKNISSNMCSFPKNLDQIKLELFSSLDTIIDENKDKMNGWIKGYLDEEIDVLQIYNNAKK